MRILITNYMETKATRGINTVVREVVKHLSKKEHEITVLERNPHKFGQGEVL